MRIAEFARQKGIKVIYYISPQVWAWKKSRVHVIKKHVDKMLVIQFVIAGVPSIEDDFYANIIKTAGVTIVKNKTQKLLLISKAALVTSGTATLETALLGVLN